MSKALSVDLRTRVLAAPAAGASHRAAAGPLRDQRRQSQPLGGWSGGRVTADPARGAAIAGPAG